MDTIVPDLATRWSWNAEMTALTFQLRQGVSWHDGEPFTAADVKCTWDLILGTGADKLRTNPRKSWYRNLDAVSTDGDTVTFPLKRPQPAFIALLASGYSPVYPCHVPAQTMRQHPIGTGPFKFVEYKPNEHIKVVKNPDYWKPGRPYLDGIDYIIVPNRSTAILGFTAGQFDMTWPFSVTLPLLKDVGWAVIDYVRSGRPVSDCRQVFLRHTAPIGPFSDQDHLHQILAKYARAAHVPLGEQRRHGMHSLRHTLATRLLEDGTPVEQIADILGHQSVAATGVYLKSSLGLLAQCALDPDASASGVTR